MKFITKLEREWKNVIFNLIFAFASLLIVAFLYDKILLCSILLIIIAIVGLIKWRSKITLILFIMVAILGPLAESFAIGFEVWQYSKPNIFDIPIWLFILWGNAGAFIHQTATEIKKLGVKEKND